MKLGEMTNQKVKIPGPGSFLGPFGATLSFFKDPIQFLNKAFNSHGRLIGVQTAPMATPPQPGYPGTVFLYGPELIKAVSKDYDSFQRTAMSHRLYPIGAVSSRQKAVTKIMTGLTHMPKEIHQRHRGMMNPLLSKSAVPEYFPNTVDIVNQTIAQWKPGETLDMSEEMLNLTLRISSRTMFGKHLENEGIKLGLLIEDWVRFVMSVGHLFPYDKPGFPYRSWLNLSQEIENETRRLINEFAVNHANEHTLIAKMIQARDGHGEGISAEDLVGHVSLLMWGSRDAVANAIVWTLFLLTQHPAIYADAVEEVQGVLHGTAPSVDQLEKMPFLNCVIKESLRLFPSFPITHRVVGQETALAGFTIPERTEIGMSVYHTHRIPELYEDPGKFSPERWNASSSNNLPLLSFGMGPRGCAGFNFGWQEMLIIIPTIIQKFRLELPAGARIDREIKVALIPKRGMPMKLNDMDNNFAASSGSVKGNVREMVTLEN